MTRLITRSTGLDLLVACFVVLNVCVPSVDGTIELNWESGYPDGTPLLSSGMEPSFSFNKLSDVKSCDNDTNDTRRQCQCGVNGYSPFRCETNFGMSDLHYQELVVANWSREGNGMLKLYADGRNAYGKGSGDSSFRNELGGGPAVFYPGDEVYYSMSFWPPSEFWDTINDYSIIITQWKKAGGGIPHGVLRLSNNGDYKLFYHNDRDLWDGTAPIAVAKKDAWNDVKIYEYKSNSSEGQSRVYLNGVKVFEHNGSNIDYDSGMGYVKFGMYTEIRDEKVIYLDAVRFSLGLPSDFGSEEEWAASTVNIPTISLTSPLNGANTASGVAISLAVNATDPAGAKLGTAGKILKVEFFVEGDCLIGVDMTAPYTMLWTPNDEGFFEFTARVIDEDNNVVTSAPVTVYSGFIPPTMTLPPMSSKFGVNETTVARATVSVQDANISNVEFFLLKDGDVTPISIGNESNPVSNNVYEASWITPSSPGAYFVYSVATSDVGKSPTSEYVGITVGGTETNTTLSVSDDASLKGRTSDRDSINNWGGNEIYGRPSTADGQQAIVSVFKVDASSLATVAEIRGASLRLFVRSGSLSPSSGAKFSIWSTTSSEDWSEDTVTWNNGPQRGEKLSAIKIENEGQYYEFDLTAFLDEKLKAGQSLSALTFWVQGDEENYEKFVCDSIRADQANPPELIVTYSDIAFPAIGASNPPFLCPTPSPTKNPTRSPTLSPTTLLEYWESLDFECARERKAKNCNKRRYTVDIEPFGNATDKMCQWQAKQCSLKADAPEGYPTAAPTSNFEGWLDAKQECGALSGKAECKTNQRCKYNKKTQTCVPKQKAPKTAKPTASPTAPLSDDEIYQMHLTMCSDAASAKACGRVKIGKRKICFYPKGKKGAGSGPCQPKMDDPSP